MENPFDMVIYDKDMAFAGFVADPIYCNFVPSWAHQGYGSFMLAADNPHSAALQAKGARVGVSYRGKHLMSGPIRSYQGDILKNAAVTYQMLDDHRLLDNALLFVRPKSPLTASSLTDLAQSWRPVAGSGSAGTVVGQTPYFYWPDGSAVSGGENVTTTEGAIKYVLRANLIERLGLPVTIAPDLGRGGDARAKLPKLRFVPLAEVMTPLEKFSGLGVTLQQRRMEATITVDVVEPGVWTQPLTPESGIIKSGTYTVGAPDITRAIIGGPGKTAARAFAGREGSAKTALEAAYNDVIEIYREGGAANLVWPEALAEKFRVAKYYAFQAAPADAQDLLDFFVTEQEIALDAGPATSGLNLDLAETAGFHFGGDDGVQLGDTVTIVINGVTFTDRVTEAQMVFSRDKGLSITPLVGDRKDDPDVALARAVAGIATALRNLSSAT